VIKAAVRHMVRATVSELGVVLLLDETSKVLRAHYIYSESPLSPEEERAMMAIDVPLGIGLTGWVAQTGQSLITGDAARDPRALQVPGTPVVDESLMVVPLMTNGRLYGVLRLDRRGLNQYRVEDLHLLELMAAHVSDAISRAQLEERMARRDALTGVYNRHYLNEWSERLQPNRSEISILMIDCRGFKQINDRWGHLEGDRVLRECARIISESVRSRDLVVRYGGDEFLVVLEGTCAQEAGVIAERLKHRVQEWNSIQPADSPRLSLDIGVETAQQSQWQHLLGRADVRMYASKRGA
jgi:diguanylate cyclase (GGDEF)-like protein